MHATLAGLNPELTLLMSFWTVADDTFPHRSAWASTRSAVSAARPHQQEVFRNELDDAWEECLSWR